jgi:hypothetical protein
MMGESRVLVASHYNASRFIYDTGVFETVWGFANCDAVDILAPGRPDTAWQTRFDGLKKRLNRISGLGADYRIAPVDVAKDYELFVYVAGVLPDLLDSERIRHWRRRSRTAVCVLLKAYKAELARFQRALRSLADFDLVYSPCLDSLDAFRSTVRSPVRYLALGAPTLDLMPSPSEDVRVIDVYSMGRRLPVLHDQLITAMISGRIHYVYDSFDGSVPFVKDFAGHCLMKAQLLKRTKFFPNFGIQSFPSFETSLAGTEDAITYRCYEGAAAGTVMFGSAPTSSDYATMFDWEDAIIPVDTEDRDYVEFLHGLEMQATRMEAARRRNVSNSLRRHDLAYRFEQIIADTGMAPHEKLLARKQRLKEAAAQFAPS